MTWVFDCTGELPGARDEVLDWIEALGDLDEFRSCAGGEGQMTLYDSLLAITLQALHDLGVHVYEGPGPGPRAA